ncbi:MAG: UDP-N-acetylmuramoyl-L-alanyl-D-glutamate--2,6-diaminopimelate ligase, partial [Bacteroidota bacterium]
HQGAAGVYPPFRTPGRRRAGGPVTESPVSLFTLLEGLAVRKFFHARYGSMVQTREIAVRRVQYDSRKVQSGDLFVAIRGGRTDGHRFAGEAVGAGAVGVVLEEDTLVPDALFLHTGAVKIVVPDARAALAVLAGNYFGHPSRGLRMAGVTGTNGKTTTTCLVRAILEAAGECTGCVGTLGYAAGGDVLPATHTTPEAPELQEVLYRMAAAGCTAAVMEVSSHALALQRVEGIGFEAAVFTNLTRDHLDFHLTMEAYGAAKQSLFRRLEPEATAVINADDPAGESMVEGARCRVLRYGFGAGADVRAEEPDLGLEGTACTIRHAGAAHRITSSLIGRFNAGNILAAFAAGIALGVAPEAIREGIRSVPSVRGRMERIPAPAGWTAVVDYAHTPDALENVLGTLRGLAPRGRGRIITVFGCGGDRDRGKRPAMGRIAARLSDRVVVTSDNPRTEDPAAIIGDILAGIPEETNLRVEPDRRAAIREALAGAAGGDVVLIAGKGHEQYQAVGERTHPFDDRREVERFIEEHG